MKKICLVLPNYGDNMMDDPCAYPLGFMYVASFVKAMGHEVKVLNFNLWDYDLLEELKGQDAVFLTGYEQFLEVNKDVAGLAKLFGLKTMVGGAMATFCADTMKKDFDGVWQGEIERSIPIDEIPWPDYDGFGIEEYNRRHSVKYMGVMTARGCPFQCAFCAQTCKFRERDMTAVFSELNHYKTKYGAEYIVFNDNTLNVTKERFLAVCNMAKATKVAWSAAIRADVFDEDMAVAAKNSGCQYFVIGVESFRQDRLDKMNKQIKVKQIVKTLDLLHKHKIGYHGNIILGFADETVEEITREIVGLPKGYNLFPVLAQPFAGTKVKSSLTEDERGNLNGLFIKYAESKGMNTYPVME